MTDPSRPKPVLYAKLFLALAESIPKTEKGRTTPLFGRPSRMLVSGHTVTRNAFLTRLCEY